MAHGKREHSPVAGQGTFVPAGVGGGGRVHSRWDTSEEWQGER